MFDVLAGRPEDLAVHVDRPTTPVRPAMPSLSTDRSGDGVTPRILDALMQVEVADRMRHDGRPEHQPTSAGTSLRRSTSGSASASGSAATCAEISPNERRTSRFQSRDTVE